MQSVSNLTNIAIDSLLLTSFGGYRSHIILEFVKKDELVVKRTIEVTRDQIILKIESQYANESKNFKR